MVNDVQATIRQLRGQPLRCAERDGVVVGTVVPIDPDTNVLECEVPSTCECKRLICPSVNPLAQCLAAVGAVTFPVVADEPAPAVCFGSVGDCARDPAIKQLTRELGQIVV